MTCVIREHDTRSPTHSSVAELSKGQTLLVQVLDAMNGYLKISPMVFVHAGFDVGKLLSSSTALSASALAVDAAALKRILALLTNAPKGTLKWHHQVSQLPPAMVVGVSCSI